MEHRLPREGGPGSFWEDRGDRHHAGVDLYAPQGARVIAIEDGRAISAGIFTSPDLIPYWNTTYQVTVAHVSGIFCRYGELGDLTVAHGDALRRGDTIGHVGEVLNLTRAGPGAPPYILGLKKQGRASMLHLEVYRSVPRPTPRYSGGNWFLREKPENILDPARILGDAV